MRPEERICLGGECVRGRGPAQWSPFLTLHVPECLLHRIHRAPAALPWEAGTGLAAQGRLALELAGCDPTVPSCGHLSGGRRHRLFVECLMTHLTRLLVLRLLLGRHPSTSRVPKDFRGCFLCLQLRRWSLVYLITSGWRGHPRATVLIVVAERM